MFPDILYEQQNHKLALLEDPSYGSGAISVTEGP